MGMKKSILMTSLAMAMMGESMGVGYPDHSLGGGMSRGGSRSRRGGDPKPAYQSREYVGYRVNQLGIDKLESSIQALIDMCEKWNENGVTKKRKFIIQGFAIMGNTQNSTRQRLRKFLAMSGLHPDTTFKETEKRFEELTTPKTEENEESKS